MSDTLTYEMRVDCYVFATIMQNRIHSHIGGTNIVTIDLGRWRDTKTNTNKQFPNPNSFSDYVGNDPIFSFSRRLGNGVLLLRAPGNKVWAKEHCITSRKATWILATNRIYIEVGHNNRWSGSWTKLQAKTQSFLQISKNTLDIMEMSRTYGEHA